MAAGGFAIGGSVGIGNIRVTFQKISLAGESTPLLH